MLESKALISDCSQYRYWLQRTWNQEKGLLTFLMLNPSTADANANDPTIRRYMRFAAGFGFEG